MLRGYQKWGAAGGGGLGSSRYEEAYEALICNESPRRSQPRNTDTDCARSKNKAETHPLSAFPADFIMI